MKAKKFKIGDLVRANVKHRRFQYCMVSLVVFVVCFAMTGGLLLTISMNTGIESLKQRIGADIIIVPQGSTRVSESALYGGEPCTVTMDSAFVDEVKGFPGVTEVASRLYFATLSGVSCCSSETQLIVTDLQHDFLLKSLTNAVSLEKRDILVGSEYYVKVGDSIKYYNRDFTVKGILPPTGTGYDTSCFITHEDAEDIMSDPEYADVFQGKDAKSSISMIFLNTEDTDKTLSHLEENYEDGDIEWFSFHSQIDDFARGIEDARVIITFFEVMLCAICLIALSCLLSVFIYNRKHEIGNLRLLQFSWSKIFSILFREGFRVVVPAAVTGFLGYNVVSIAFSAVIASLFSVPILPLTFFGVLVVLSGIIAFLVFALAVATGVAFLGIKRMPLVELVKGGD